MTPRLKAALAAVIVLAAVPAARGSQVIVRGASEAHLRVNSRAAEVTFRVDDEWRTVRAWGAVNALTQTRARQQVQFRLAWTRARERGACLPYDGPPLHWLVAACTAPDGSYWALQSWRRGLPNYGVRPGPGGAKREFRLSHWRGAPARLYVNVDWTYGGDVQHLYGALAYRGRPVFGFAHTRRGAPLDPYGRNVYLDTLDSAYGPGWRRENAFLTRSPSGAFCYGFFPHAPRPAGAGRAYRVTVVGPGVTPDLFWAGRAPGRYDPMLDRERDAEQRALGTPASCYAHRVSRR